MSCSSDWPVRRQGHAYHGQLSAHGRDGHALANIKPRLSSHRRPGGRQGRKVCFNVDLLLGICRTTTDTTTGGFGFGFGFGKRFDTITGGERSERLALIIDDATKTPFGGYG